MGGPITRQNIEQFAEALSPRNMGVTMFAAQQAPHRALADKARADQETLVGVDYGAD